MLNVLMTALGCCFPSRSNAAESTARYILLDARSASDSELADIFTAVTASSGQNEWRIVTPSPSDELTDVLAREYNLTRPNLPLYPATNQALRAMIKTANPGVNIDLSPLTPGALRVPPPPSIPSKGIARADLVQVQGKDHKYFVVQLSALVAPARESSSLRSRPTDDLGLAFQCAGWVARNSTGEGD